MQCNFLNEGCEGGWPHLNAYFMEKGYMIDEKCAPYKGMTKGQQCSNYKACKPTSKVIKTEWVGDGWGEVSEK